MEEFKKEAFKLFENLLGKIRLDFITFLNNIEVVPEKQQEMATPPVQKNNFRNSTKCLITIKQNSKISRNEKCPATGKKFKHCCGSL